MNAEADILEQADADFAEALAEALDIREHETGDHSKRVACHTLVLARRFITDPHHLREIYWGSLLHDVGKIGVADAILLKHDALNEDEWMEMRTHPEKGHHKEVSTMNTLGRASTCGMERWPSHLLSDNKLEGIS